MRRTAGALIASAVLLLAGCAEKTALMIEIDSSLAAPDDVDALDLVVVGRDSGQMLERTLELESGFPHTFSVLPGNDDGESVTITVTGLKGGEFVVRRVVRATFQAGSEVQVPIALYEACVGIECAVGVDCVAGRCTNTALPPDAGVGDGGVPMPDCESDEECDDGDPCNGREECEGGSCVSPGTPDCDDGVACTVDSCADQECSHTPDDSLCIEGDTCDATMGCGGRECDPADDGSEDPCDDGNVCNGTERCMAGTCRTDPPPDCDDGIACTVDACDESAGGCTNVPNDAICDDGLFCNGTETCDPDAGCGMGAAPDCDDADDCTDDFCSNMVMSCVHQTRDVDGDGWGDSACTESGGIPATDCNDRSGGVHPGAIEVCDGTDQDCDGDVDEGCGGGCDESCPGATTVSMPGGRFTPTLSDASHTGSCGGAGSEALLTFTLTETSDVFVTTHGSTVDTVLYVRSCECNGSELACNDDADGLTSSVLRLSSLGPGTYNVFVDTKTTMSVPVQVDLYATPTGGPADRCGRAMNLAGSIAGNTCGAASDLGGSCVGGGDLDAPDHVYYFVVSGSTSSVTLDTCTGCTRFNTTLDVRTVCTSAGATSRVACEDDGCRSGCVGGPKRHATLTRDLAPGLYYVFVDGPAGECGDYTLTLSGL